MSSTKRRRRTSTKPPATRAQHRPDSIAAASAIPREELQAVARFLEVDESEPGLLGVVAAAKAYGLSPFLGQLFLIDSLVKSRDAEGHLTERWVKRAATGRDGFLSVAMKSGVHRGLHGDVVCANDSFDVDWSVGGREAPQVLHRHAPLLPGKSSSEARDYRGPIIGAWAKGYRADMAPFFYFAPLREHGRTWEAEGGRGGWAGAWEYTSAMILKCAGSYVLRMLYSITGVVPADELRNDPTLLDGGTIEITQVLDVGEAIPESVDAAVRERLLAAVNAANEVDPALWPAAKCEMVFAGRSSAELDVLAGQIEKTLEGIRGRRERSEEEAARDAVMPPVDTSTRSEV